MNKDQIHGKWNEIKGEITKAWGKITNDELDQAKGNATELAGLVQRKYGTAKDEASKKIDGIFEKYSNEKKCQREEQCRQKRSHLNLRKRNSVALGGCPRLFHPFKKVI